MRKGRSSVRKRDGIRKLGRVKGQRHKMFTLVAFPCVQNLYSKSTRDALRPGIFNHILELDDAKPKMNILVNLHLRDLLPCDARANSPALLSLLTQFDDVAAVRNSQSRTSDLCLVSPLTVSSLNASPVSFAQHGLANRSL